MATSHVWAPHDDGTWRLAQLLDQYRGPDGWRCVVTYCTGPGMRYLRRTRLRSCAVPTSRRTRPARGHAA
jgi:hypothetical protein